ncbi:formimidoylglutamate deiminase [Pseudoclavibacter sp. RFBJ3]|uniref:formimidoylglutamate deiminase n=1 Tax=unclassified Pseudoclavibacter TaxID=2615177 RepID=UPI000CE82918|nr:MULTISPECIES: formimidoylglutamate deiminase [unclassified Pseudoclavibacter]PPF84897.1 formimidoylglutamate deiminase [Pseudoclavibacter sp. RFBJ5]PPF93901.1 formimidoylglutamate deiminase [Pseudoclavibacter sp. RFBJ3]PPF98619.1 formimidoylglutamate deiminase [Pseudoclavibacter sp. RFBH5]PPG24420.1 formimidoylglutamate deiminase [Pseudoclavibacter sp. RFBI4]
MSVEWVWIETLVRGDVVLRAIRLRCESGEVVEEQLGVPAAEGDLVLGTVFPAFGNAHSHVFHRLLRGRTHADGGNFWSWRDKMYAIAGRLTPESLERIATACFTEMMASGWGAVGEFHYVHHQPDGTPYPDHDMELALARAAETAGIRLTLLDTCYLAGSIGTGLSAQQLRFGDGHAARWIARWFSLGERLRADHPQVVLGAALHSVRAVPTAAIAEITRTLPDDVPLHVHLSEQVAENEQSLAAHGRTPTELLADAGALTRRLSVVHATHLSEHDIALLGAARVHAVFCPTTEADLGDGIGPGTELAAAGARLAVGSDQNAVVDPLLELRGLEAGERLRSQTRGRFSPGELTEIGTTAGYASLGFASPATLGGPFDLVEVDAASVRTAGSHPAQLVLTGTSSDVLRTVVAGRVVYDRESDSARMAQAAAELAVLSADPSSSADGISAGSST